MGKKADLAYEQGTFNGIQTLATILLRKGLVKHRDMYNILRDMNQDWDLDKQKMRLLADVTTATGKETFEERDAQVQEWLKKKQAA